MEYSKLVLQLPDWIEENSRAGEQEIRG